MNGIIHLYRLWDSEVLEYKQGECHVSRWPHTPSDLWPLNRMVALRRRGFYPNEHTTTKCRRLVVNQHQNIHLSPGCPLTWGHNIFTLRAFRFLWFFSPVAPQHLSFLTETLDNIRTFKKTIHVDIWFQEYISHTSRLQCQTSLLTL